MAVFVKDINKLFDSFNSVKRAAPGKTLCSPLSNNSPHIHCWTKASMGIKSWIFLQDGKPACKKFTLLQSGWIIDTGVVNAFVMIDEAFAYLAVAESSQFCTLITPYMLSKCEQELYNVCPSEMMLKTAGEPNCLTALFLGNTDIMISRCKRLILNETVEPIWVRSPDASYWIYSLSVTQRVTVRCQKR